ncbi:MAG: FdhF/YdeP family oxidoreductase [Candidatus Thalassarchaeaceae archaeon]|nr:FdhF/YdeP family oxidoreductase [Candidatus Thalassarchaeaceae archaeon]
MRVTPEATTPVEDILPRKGAPSTSAAGLPAILSTAKHSVSKMGLLASLSNLSNVNKFHGFDCPGCAWPDPDHKRTFAEFCENGAKAIADEATKKRADPGFWSKWSVSELSKKPDYWLNRQGRITHPLILREGSDNYEKISWTDAFKTIAGELANLNSPDEAIFYTSGRTSNEAAYLWQLLARSFGTNNLPDCSNMCHESSGVALTESIGIGKGTVKLEDFDKADLIIVVGQNPGTNHPRMLTALRDAKRKGASVVSINPLIEAGMVRFKHPQNPLEVLGYGNEISDEHVRVRINGDQALFRGFAKSILTNSTMDMEFIEKFTDGYELYHSEVMNSSWEDIVEISGVEKSEIQRIGELVGKSKSTICCWAMGLTQHKNSVATIQEIANVLLLGGHIGRGGAGLCPVRGHSNVQGDRTVGINHNPPIEFLVSLNNEFGIDVPEGGGLDAVDSVRQMNKGGARIFVSMGGNFLSAMSDTKATAKGLQKCSLTAHISTKPNRSHLVTGRTSIILPCLGRTELDITGGGTQFVTVENSMGVVHKSIGKRKPASEHLLSECAIVAGLATAIDDVMEPSGIPWSNLVSDYDRIRDCIERTIPGFDSFNERCRVDGGFYLPNPPRDNRAFRTETGLANIITHKLQPVVIRENEFLMMTIRSHDQYNTTIYSTNDRYRGISRGRRVVMMSRKDLESRGWKEFQAVSITSHFRGDEISSDGWFIVEYDIPQGNVATYFPESNVLIPLESVADGSNTPTSKSVIVTIEPMN